MLKIFWCCIIAITTKLIYPIAQYLSNRERSVSKSILLGIKDIIITLIGDILIIAKIFAGDTMKLKFGGNPLCEILVWSVLQIIGAYIFVYLKRRKSVKDMTFICLVSMLFPILNLFVIPFVSIEVISADFIIWLTVVSGIFADVALLYVIYTMSDVKLYKQNIQLHEKELSLITDMRQDAKDDEDRLVKLKNEYQQELNNIYKIYSESAENSLCNEYIDQLEQKIKSTKNSKCYNVIVNTILTDKEEECNRSGIQFSCDVKLGENTGISNLHLCSIFTNLINNAIEACECLQHSEKYINVKCYVKGQYLNISVTNSADGKVKKIVKRKGRGYGFKILEDIAATYSGRFKYEYKQDEFKAIMSVLVNAEEEEKLAV